MKLNNLGFTLTEVVAGATIAIVVSLLSARPLIQMASIQNNLEVDSVLTELAHTSSLHIKKTADCVANLSVPTVALTAAQTPAGMPIDINLADYGTLIQDGSTFSIGAVEIDVDTVRLANATVVSNDALNTVIVGDVILGLQGRQNVNSYNLGGGTKRQVSAGRLQITLDTAGTVTSCNAQTNLDASTSTCTQMGAIFDPACPASPNGCCVWRFNENLGPIDFCQLGEAGVTDPDSGPNCEVANSSCPEAASGITLGSFECSPANAAAAAAYPAQPTANPPSSVGPGSPTIPTGLQPDCIARWRNYAVCLAAAFFSSGPFTCGGTPPTTGCVAPTTGTTPAVNPAAPPIPPPPVTCDCGSGTINNGEYCGFCILDLDYGYGFLETIYEVRRCNAGALTIVPDAASVIPITSIQCNGARRRVFQSGLNYGF